MLEYHYPEILGQSYILNAPGFFKACWVIIKQWVNDLTASKVIFISRRRLPECLDEAEIHPDVGNKKDKLLVPGGDDELPPLPPLVVDKAAFHNKERCEVCNSSFSSFGVITGRTHCRKCYKSVCKKHHLLNPRLGEKLCLDCDKEVNALPPPPAEDEEEEAEATEGAEPTPVAAAAPVPPAKAEA